MTFGKELGVIVASYALGCFTFGYYLARWRAGVDVRSTGSGSAGGSNVARVLGPPGLLATIVGDVAKGAAAAGAAVLLGLEAWGFWLVAFAVVAGHIWPAQLGFRGGKGAATAGGTLLVFDFWVVVVFTLIVLLMFVVFRRTTPSGLVAVTALPAVAAILGYTFVDIAGIIALVTVVLVAHRSNIRQMFSSAHPASVGR